MAKEKVNKIFSARPCPACGSASYHKRGFKGPFEMVSCRGCNTLYTASLPDAESAEDYNHYYHEENLNLPDFILRRLDEIIADFSSYRQNGRLLDLGFGAGTLIEAAGRAGWQAAGVEVSQPAVEHVRSLGFDVFCGTLAEANYPTDHFDVVTASEVLEHVSDPQLVVMEIARVLRPGGLLWLTTPHGRSISAHLLGLKWSTVSPPEHLQLFSRRGAKQMLDAAGLRPVRVMTEGVNPYELLNGVRGKGEGAPASGEGKRDDFDRVESGYQLNEALMASPSRRLLKDALNGLLNAGRLGDTLKIWAEK